jgi:hypothetical protein
MGAKLDQTYLAYRPHGGIRMLALPATSFFATPFTPLGLGSESNRFIRVARIHRESNNTNLEFNPILGCRDAKIRLEIARESLAEAWPSSVSYLGAHSIQVGSQCEHSLSPPKFT